MKLTRFYSMLLNCLLLGVSACRDHSFDPEADKPNSVSITTFATGLISPLGLETDAQGNLWVTEAGSGTGNDGRLTVITPKGDVYPVVTGFVSQVSPEGAVFGLNHLLLQGHVLYLLHGVEGRIYRFDITNYQPGDAPRSANDLPFEDIGSFVKAYPFEDDTDETDLFNLTTGPGGDLFIVDAGANAIIRRRAATGALSVFATLPAIANPTPNAPPVEAVPTGIVFDGRTFLVATFTGFPFPAGQATLYEIDQRGKVSVFRSGFSCLADLELAINRKPVVVEYGTWTGETFAPNSGRVTLAGNGKPTPLLTGLNFPNSIERGGVKTYYLAQTFDGVVLKVSQ